jgi:hypothetical protein
MATGTPCPSRDPHLVSCPRCPEMRSSLPVQCVGAGSVIIPPHNSIVLSSMRSAGSDRKSRPRCGSVVRESRPNLTMALSGHSPSRSVPPSMLLRLTAQLPAGLLPAGIMRHPSYAVYMDIESPRYRITHSECGKPEPGNRYGCTTVPGSDPPPRVPSHL